MKDFIINNNSWLQYLKGFVIFFSVVFIATVAELIYLIVRKQKSRELKSRKKKSEFAREYTEYAAQTAVSSKPLERENRGISATHKAERKNLTVPSVKPAVQDTNSVLEFYFEFEDDFKL